MNKRAFSKMRGAVTAEYVMIMLSLIGLWYVAGPRLMQAIQTHYSKVSWVLSLPI
jgi:hypothetical protein